MRRLGFLWLFEDRLLGHVALRLSRLAQSA
jgi:hypothetical protein